MFLILELENHTIHTKKNILYPYGCHVSNKPCKAVYSVFIRQVFLKMDQRNFEGGNNPFILSQMRGSSVHRGFGRDDGHDLSGQV